jgi:hypothetical protein
MNRNELVVAAVAAGITKAHSMKSVVLEEMLANMSKPETTGKRGRPVDTSSVRQKRLAELEAKRANGELKRGRPVDMSSPRQIRLAIQAENKANGIGQGRPVNADSARQKRLAELAAKAEANGGVVKRGRPAQIKNDEIAG